ncbi:VOC family protein [Desulfosporosinus sp.]|uniref:VOC family protein n=1 Tax=Desulfosporosinus sp. TaxID=157907 RepID=UPI00230EEA4E|nr:VOC family protein [Desulfosporosinus sp.]MCO5388542.1 VOC family protein [Desulfosporosinus sp.]MDA8222940.1 VOC family protein [Desulfitobacterium hafniense]
MKYTCTLIAVRNIEKAKQFYHDVLGLEVVADFGANVTMTGGIALQTADTWKGFIHKQDEEIVFGNNACELYFEEDDMDSFVAKLNIMKGIEYIHPLFEHSWGQRVVRFYDLDRHIIEVGENMIIVVKRFIETGLSIEETANRMDVPVDYVRSCST